MNNPTSEIISLTKKEMRLGLTCRMCNTKKELILDPIAYNAWIYSVCIQDAFPKLSVDDREFMQSGICGECFDKMFREPEE